MNTENDRIKMSITFNQYESRLIRAAAKIVMPIDPLETGRNGDHRRIVWLALAAYCRGVIRAGAGSESDGGGAPQEIYQEVLKAARERQTGWQDRCEFA